MIISIIIVHTLVMNMHRITFSIPANTHALLAQQIDSGNVSRFISETIHSRLVETAMNRKLKKNAVDEFLALRKATKKLPIQKILTAIHTGRRMSSI
jgi:hypothetical protein